MDEERVVTEYAQALRSTRASIGDTLDQLRGRFREATDWRHYVDQYPAGSLGLALGVGLIGGRFIGGAVSPVRSAQRPPRVVGSTAGPNPAGEPSETHAGAAASWRSIGGRAGTRLEAIAIRLVDEMASIFEAAIVPAVLTRFQRMLGVRETARETAMAAPGRRDRAA
jgi:hypothetical protein